jgi:hypothetical protein
VRTSPALPARTTQSADKYAVFKASVAEHYRRCESMRDRASWRVPATRRGRERSLPSGLDPRVPPPPKAQPAPGNAQATGTAPGSGISGKPAGSPSARRTDGVRSARGQHHPGALNLSGRPTEGGHRNRHVAGL